MKRLDIDINVDDLIDEIHMLMDDVNYKHTQDTYENGLIDVLSFLEGYVIDKVGHYPEEWYS